ncbi:hypothetical protein Tco_1024735 [Tanacetum coccineum]
MGGDEIEREDGYCNGGNFPGAYHIGNSLHYQDLEWYEALEDCELKNEALRNKAIMEGLISDDESSNDCWKRWKSHEIYYHNYNEGEYENETHEKGHKLCDEEEYVAVKESEYNDLTITSDEACRAYQEIFQIMDEGWMVTITESDLGRQRKISTNSGDKYKSGDLEVQKARILELKRRYFEDYYSDYQYAVSIKEDTAYPCLHSPKTTKETSSIRRIQRRPIRRIQDIVCEYSGRYQTWSLLQETPIRRIQSLGYARRKRAEEVLQRIPIHRRQRVISYTFVIVILSELQRLIEVVPDKEEVAIDAIPLATKPPTIVDWKIHKEGKKNYYQIIRADGSSKMYLVFSHMLKSFDREDLETLWKLVKAKHGSTRPEEGYERVLWGDLKTMFDPHVEDQVWRNQQDYRVLDWKIYDSCGVHSLRMQHMHIHMLVEKRYPLTPATITDMLNKKLQCDHFSEMAYQLLKLLTKQLKNQ